MTDDQMGNATCETKSGDNFDDATASQKQERKSRSVKIPRSAFQNPLY
jgi:hypothetical protein